MKREHKGKKESTLKVSLQVWSIQWIVSYWGMQRQWHTYPWSVSIPPSSMWLILLKSGEWPGIYQDKMFHYISKTQSSPNVLHHFINYIDIALISGVVSGFLGGAAGSLTFISSFNALTHYFYTTKKYSDWDFRLKNFCIYIISDFAASFAKIFFETRKQLIQMCNYESTLN